jgi:hypothetical protein
MNVSPKHRISVHVTINTLSQFGADEHVTSGSNLDIAYTRDIRKVTCDEMLTKQEIRKKYYIQKMLTYLSYFTT